MKKLYILMAAALMGLVSGCAVDDPSFNLLEENGIPMTFVATCGADQAGTKTTYNESDGKVYWSVGDQIGVYYGTSRVSRFTSEATEPSRTATFTGSLSYTSVAGSYFWAVSPYSAADYLGSDNTSVKIRMPSTQTVGTSTFCPDAALMVARSSDQNLSFKNVYTGLRFTLSHEGIKSIVFKSNGSQRIAGNADVSLDDTGTPVLSSPTGGNQIELIPASGAFETGKYYYLLFFPATLEQGFTLTFSTDAGTGVFNHTASVSFDRNQIREVQNIDSGVSFNSLDAIPDPAFRAYVLATFDKDHDGTLSDEEKNNAKTISLTTDNVSSLEGIALFPNLTTLSCSGSSSGKGKLAALDLSQNTALTSVYCSNNQLTSLDASNLLSLKTLNCNSNKLTSLTVAGSTALTDISCTNNQLTSLDVSNLPVLSKLTCYYNELTSLTLTGSTALTQILCFNNQLTELELSGLTNLTSLSCGSNNLASLMVSECTALTSLSCYGNALTTLDVSGLTTLVELTCSSNDMMTDLTLSGCTSLSKLKCNFNNLSALDFTGLSALTELDCGWNENLGTLDVSGLTNLVKLDCRKTGISSLALTNLTALTELDCSNNENIGTLDVSGLTNLVKLDCSYTGISSLALATLTDLTSLKCSTNNLTSLDVSNNLKLQELDCRWNSSLATLYLKVGQTIASLQKPDDTNIEYLP